MIELPKSVKIGPYEVSIVRRKLKKDFRADWKFGKKQIRIERTSDDATAMSSLIHELWHAIVDVRELLPSIRAIAKNENEDEAEEALILLLESAVMDFLGNNSDALRKIGGQWEQVENSLRGNAGSPLPASSTTSETS